MELELIQLGSILIFLVLFSIFSYKRKLLDFEGILIANAVGLAAITYGPNPLLDFLVVVVFFVIGEIASNYPKRKHDKRGIWNVVGNSLPALIALTLILIYPEFSFAFELAFFGAISAALADTLSSEVGYYSKSKPRLITNFKKVPRGTDGGVTFLGELAGFCGGFVIAIIYYSFNPNIFAFLALLLAGLIGTNIDSLFGAIFETKKLMDNTQVNMIGSFSGAICAFIIAILLVI